MLKGEGDERHSQDEVWTPGRLGGVGQGAGQARKDTGLIKSNYPKLQVKC